MNDAPQDAWFYSREGERIGPVAFSELRAKAAVGGLNPRLDMVWTQGMAEWKPAGEMEGLFERRLAPEPPPNLASAADPYTTPQQKSADEHMAGITEWPGARRRSYLFAIFVVPFLINLFLAFASVMLKNQFGEEIFGFITLGAAALPVLIAIYFGIQRLANVGMSRWWYLGNFVPLLNIWIGYRCFACPGGYAYHKKLDGIGIFLAIIYWLFILIGLIAIAAVIALLAGAAGSPELQEQFREYLRTFPIPKS